MDILGFNNRKTRLIATVASYLNDRESSSINTYNVVI